jgi:hypothetical protein
MTGSGQLQAGQRLELRTQVLDNGCKLGTRRSGDRCGIGEDKFSWVDKYGSGFWNQIKHCCGILCPDDTPILRISQL